MTRAVFLDRDGTLVEEGGYLDRVDRLALFPWSIEAIRILNRAGFRVVVVTNQAGVARGIFPETVVHELHDHLRSLATAAGARIDGLYYCPHHPESSIEQYRLDCDCRKPRPGLLRRAAQDLDLDLRGSYVVGDRWLDVMLAQNVGGQGILVETGYGATEARMPPPGVSADAVLPHLAAAVGWILERERRGAP